MNNEIRAINAIHAERTARFRAEAEQARIVHEINIARRDDRSHGRWIRRAVGRSIVRLGARIAADPAVERCVLAAGRGAGRSSTFDGVPIP